MIAAPARSAGTPVVLRAEPVTAQVLPKGEPLIRMLGFNGMTPGPTLRVQQGETLSVDFQNRIGEGSAVHWHGIRIDNAMDGVPYLTQDMVADGADFAYRFKVPDAGTYWYHAHNRSWEQVAKGLYGPLIVEETLPPRVDHDIPVVIDDFRLDDAGALAGRFGNRHDFAHAGRLGNFARAFAAAEHVRIGDRVRLRLINTATARSFFLYVTGIEGVVVALDGMPLSRPEVIGDILLAPAQRIDIIADVTRSIAIDMWTQNGNHRLGEIAVQGVNPAEHGPITALPKAKVPVPGRPDRMLELRLQGGAMGGAHQGNDLWSFSGISNLPDTPLARIERGETVRIRLINETRFDHGIHTHGHHFIEVRPDGGHGAYRDTTLVKVGETRDLLCVFDNPGKWLLHCHMLDHAASGMKTWVEVV